MANTTYNLGRVGLKLRGEYDPNAAYKPLDVVSWHGGSYAAKADTTGIAPSDSDKWEVLAQGPGAGRWQSCLRESSKAPAARPRRSRRA